MIAINAHNFSLLGTANNSSAFVALKLFTDSVIFNDCTGISIAKFVFELCECTRCNGNEPAIYIISCVDCSIEQVSLSQFTLLITNMMGNSCVNNITIKINDKSSNAIHFGISIISKY